MVRRVLLPLVPGSARVLKLVERSSLRTTLGLGSKTLRARAAIRSATGALPLHSCRRRRYSARTRAVP